MKAREIGVSGVDQDASENSCQVLNDGVYWMTSQVGPVKVPASNPHLHLRPLSCTTLSLS